jgi:hypothetical protein
LSSGILSPSLSSSKNIQSVPFISKHTPSTSPISSIWTVYSWK